MASVDTPDPSLDIEDNPTSASFMPKKSGDGLEEAKETDVSDPIEDPTCQKSKQPNTLTEKGLEYQRLLKEKDYQRALRILKDKLHKLDMDWIDISDPHILRKERSDIEELRQDLDKAQSEYVPLLTGKESYDAVEATAYLNKQVVELRIRAERYNKTQTYTINMTCPNIGARYELFVPHCSCYVFSSF